MQVDDGLTSFVDGVTLPQSSEWKKLNFESMRYDTTLVPDLVLGEDGRFDSDYFSSGKLDLLPI